MLEIEHPITLQPGKTDIDRLEEKVESVASSVFGGRLTVAVLTMKNGMLITGESCKDTAEGFNEKIGLDIAIERAMEKALQFELYARRELAPVAIN